MTRANVPERVAWAVSMMNIRPTDHVLEVGCGRGEAVALISGMLDGGTITAIDRSGTMIAIASERNAAGVAAGVVTFQSASPAVAEFGDGPFDLIFAINVGSLWRQRPRTTWRDCATSSLPRAGCTCSTKRRPAARTHRWPLPLRGWRRSMA